MLRMSMKGVAVCMALVLAVGLCPSAAFAGEASPGGLQGASSEVGGNRLDLMGLPIVSKDEFDNWEVEPEDAYVDTASGKTIPKVSVTYRGKTVSPSRYKLTFEQLDANGKETGKSYAKNTALGIGYYMAMVEVRTSDGGGAGHGLSFHVKLPYETRTLGDGTLKVVEYLGSSSAVVIPEKIGGKVVSAVVGYAFSESNPVSITIPKTVTKFDGGNMGSRLASINVASGNKVYKSIGGVLFDRTGKTLVRFPEGKTGSYKVPQGVKAIAGDAFRGARASTVKFSSTVRKIGSQAFSESRVTKVELNKGLKTVAAQAFYNSGLVSVKLPSTVKKVEEFAFCESTKLRSVKLDEGLKSIGYHAFSNTAISKITIPKSVKKIQVKDGVWPGTKGCGTPFICCAKLKAIKVAAGNKKYSSNGGVLFDKKQKKLIVYPSGKKAKTYKVPSTVKAIGAYAFYGDTHLKKVKLPSKLKAIGLSSFSCFVGTKLKSVTVPDSVKRIGDYAFYGCSKLTVSVPSKTKTGKDAFGYAYAKVKKVKRR